jgi:hypothetical protein
MPAVEQRPQQHHLRVAGVLVLVEQHHPEPVAFDRADRRVVAGHDGRPRELVAEVHRLQIPLAPFVGPHQRQ